MTELSAIFRDIETETRLSALARPRRGSRLSALVETRLSALVEFSALGSVSRPARRSRERFAVDAAVRGAARGANGSPGAAVDGDGARRGAQSPRALREACRGALGARGPKGPRGPFGGPAVDGRRGRRERRSAKPETRRADGDAREGGVRPARPNLRARGSIPVLCRFTTGADRAFGRRRAAALHAG